MTLTSTAMILKVLLADDLTVPGPTSRRGHNLLSSSWMDSTTWHIEAEWDPEAGVRSGQPKR